MLPNSCWRNVGQLVEFRIRRIHLSIPGCNKKFKLWFEKRIKELVMVNWSFATTFEMTTLLSDFQIYHFNFSISRRFWQMDLRWWWFRQGKLLPLHDFLRNSRFKLVRFFNSLRLCILLHLSGKSFWGR